MVHTTPLTHILAALGMAAALAGCAPESSGGSQPDPSDGDVTFDGAPTDGGAADAIADAGDLDLGAPDQSDPDQSDPDMVAPDLAAPDLAAPDMLAPDQSPPDMGPPVVCGDGELGAGEACDGEPRCADCAWVGCEPIGLCKVGRITPPQHPGAADRAVARGDHLLVANPSAEVAGARTGGEVFAFRPGDGGWARVQRLVSPNPVRDGSFGSTLAVLGDTLAVAEPGADRAHLYTWDGEAWAREGAVTFPGMRTLALGDGWLVAGAMNRDRDAGALGVFQRTPEGWVAVEAPPFPVAQGDRLGRVVAVEGDWLMAGAEGTDEAGAVHFARRTEGGWEAVQTVPAPDMADEGAQFGRQLALGGPTAVVGVHGAGEGRGALAFLALGEDEVWQLTDWLTPAQAVPGDRLGSSVAIEGDRAVARIRRTRGGGADARDGEVWAFERGEGGWALAGPLSRPGSGSFGTRLFMAEGRTLVSLGRIFLRLGNTSMYTTVTELYE